MPKRKNTQNRKRKNKKGKNKNQINNNNDSSNRIKNDSNIDFDALIEQQLQNEETNNNKSFSQMLKNKIMEIEQSQKRKENAALYKQNVILQQMNIMKQDYNASDESNKHINDLYKFITQINNIFYDVLNCETNLRLNSTNLIQQNETLKKLCNKLQNDKKILCNKISSIENREKTWRREIESKFENSLSDIKDKIGSHEERYDLVVTENQKLRQQLETFLQYDTKRTNDFELYKTHQSKLDEIHNKEKENFNQMLEKERQEKIKLTINLKQVIEVNDLLKQRCKQYEVKFNEMSKTVKESSQCIDEYKKMNIELMKQNKSLHNKLNDIMTKYKQLNSYNDTLTMKNLKANKRIDTLSELCRKLQSKNKNLTENNYNIKNKKQLSQQNRQISQNSQNSQNKNSQNNQMAKQQSEDSQVDSENTKNNNNEQAATF